MSGLAVNQSIRLNNGWILQKDDKSTGSPVFKVTNRFGETFELPVKQLGEISAANCKLQYAQNKPVAIVIKPSLGLRGGQGEIADFELNSYHEETLFEPTIKAIRELPKEIQLKLLSQLPIDPIPVKKRKKIDKASIEFKCSKSASIQALIKHAWSFQTYMKESLYGPHGYYTSGKIKFQIDASDGDFSTSSTDGTELAQQAANQSFMMWKSMLEAGDMQPDEPFTILEAGGGEMLLAHNILTYLKERFASSSNLEMQQFAKVIQYKVVEISPALIERGRNRNKAFIEEGKLEILQGDACSLSKIFRKGEFKGLGLSNELIDAFPLHQVRLNARREMQALVVVPYLEDLDEISKDNPQLAKRLFKKSIHLEHLYERFNFPAEKKGIFLSTKDLKSLPKDLLKNILWHHVYLPTNYFSDLKNFIEDHGIYFLKMMKAGNKAYINTSVDSFMEAMGTIFEKGFVMTIDYGGDHNQGVDRDHSTSKNLPLRLFPYWYNSEPLSNPHLGECHNNFGQCDLTASVNFTVLAKAGEKHGLKPLHFLEQSELENMMDLIPEMERVSSPKGISRSFHVLIQQIHSTNALYCIPCKTKPVSYSELNLKSLNSAKFRYLAFLLRKFTKGRNLSSETLFDDFNEFFYRHLSALTWRTDRIRLNNFLSCILKIILLPENDRPRALAYLQHSRQSQYAKIIETLKFYYGSHLNLKDSSNSSKASAKAMVALNFAVRQPQLTSPEPALINKVMLYAFGLQAQLEPKASEVNACLIRHIGNDFDLKRIFFPNNG